MSQYFLGIDPSITNTGVVLLNGDATLAGSLNAGIAAGKEDGSYKGFWRYMRQASWIGSFLQQHCGKDDDSIYCCYEDYSFGSIHRGFDLAEFGGVLKNTLIPLCQTIWLVSPKTNKKFLTGNGAATKQAMKEAAIYELPALSGETSDVCDAFSLALMAATKVNPALEYTTKSLTRTRYGVADGISKVVVEN